MNVFVSWNFSQFPVWFMGTLTAQCASSITTRHIRRDMDLFDLDCARSSDDDSGINKLFTCNVAARDYFISVLQEI